MAIQPFDVDIAADTVQFALPFLDQMRWGDNQHHLIVSDLSTQLLDHTGGDADGGRPSHERLTCPHAANQQDAVP